MARRRLNDREQSFHKHSEAERRWIVEGVWPFPDNPTASDALAEWRRGEAALHERIATMNDEADRLFTRNDLAVETAGLVGQIKDVVSMVSDLVTGIGPVFTAAATVVAKEQRRAGPTAARPWVYDPPARYRDTPDKRRFLVDNDREFRALVTLRHNLRNAAKHQPFPHPEDHRVYLILLASTADLAALLGTNAHDVSTSMDCLGRWGYALDLGVRNDGNRRIGKAWLFGRMLHDGPRRSEPSWLEPPCVVPPRRAYRCETWDDRHVQASWANPDGDGLHTTVPAAWMCRLSAARDKPTDDRSSAEAEALAASIRGR